MHRSHVLRSAEGEDRSFLEQLLVQAYNWDGQQRVTLDQVRTDSLHRKYLEGWKQLGDVGVLAYGPDGEMAGGAWARAVPREQAGYGWVAPDVPELAMAVLPGFQGKRLGARLLDACLNALREEGFHQVSLSDRSVEHSSP